MKFELDRLFKSRIEKKIESFNFEVGILQDKPHKKAQEVGLFDALGEYAGGPVRKASRELSGLSIAEILMLNQERLNTDLLRTPFQKESDDMNKFVRAFLKYAFSKGGSVKRVENLLQAVVRNPILRQEYGKNTYPTRVAKTFDRNLIDTGQMFKNIRARVISV